MEREFMGKNMKKIIENQFTIDNFTQKNREVILMDIYGLKVLILGEFGVWMSETTIELIKRGHHLIINDDLKNIQLVVKLNVLNYQNNSDSIAIEKQNNKLLSLNVFILEIPVKPKQNIPVIIETAAMNQRLKNMGYNENEITNMFK